uniref:Uncharacterized protein n=1 Tax=Amphora coffeiformis TaxID=265554 RepID=A0A7S3KZ86_9STRA|mmetsp:Transcript_15126/g.28674  ORF Transcript_15126/g.28674 Transcript_15126/m.28674 type:complete len:108 (+) Transcript_15126:73-396(+)
MTSSEEETSVESSMSDDNNDDNIDNDSNNNGDDDDDDNKNELDRIKNECQAMLTLLQRLAEEEEDLREKNCMLAREALLCGFQMEQLEAPPPKRRMKSTAATGKEEK